MIQHTRTGMESGTHIILQEKQPLTLEALQQQALELMLRDGTHAPLVLVEGTRGNASMVLSDLPEEGERKQKFFFCKGIELSQAYGHIGVLLQIYSIMEAWVGANRHVVPKDDPHHTEALVISSVDILTKVQRVHLFKMERDTHGVVRKLTPFHPEMKQVVNRSLLECIAGYVYALKRGHQT